MTTYGDALTLEEARRIYFEANRFGADGGYDARWVRLMAGPLPLFIYNTQMRVRAVRFHDLHHVLTGYQTDWIGEAEIGAWEIASGCADHYPAWYLNLSAMVIGLVLAPRRVFAAFLRGRRTRNLYRERFGAELLAERVGPLRQRLGLEQMSAGPARPADLGWFAGATALGLIAWAFNLALLPLALPFSLASMAIAAWERKRSAA